MVGSERPRTAGRSATGLFAVALTAGAVQLAPTAPLAAQRPPLATASVQVAGEVVDVESGNPIHGARVHLEGPAGAEEVGPVETDRDGTFTFPAVTPGRHLLRIVRIGYRTLTDTIVLTGGGDAQVRASMVPEAVDLEPLVVTAVRRVPSFMRGFERRRARGFGTFLTRADIDERRAYATSDLFRTLPGVRVVSRTAMDGPVLTMRGGCRPGLYVDGMHWWGDLSVDHTVQPDDLEAVEIYSAAATPPQYRQDGCGVILMWTRPGQPSTREGSWWKRLAVVGGLLLGGVILAR